MTSDSNPTDTSSWKRRCLQLEQQQEGLQADTELLGKVLQRLCAAAKGIDQELDGQLAPLQKALKQQPLDSGFRRHAGSVERGMLNVFQRRDEAVRRSLEALRELIGQLEALPRAQVLTPELHALLASLPEGVENYYDYPRMLQELARLQGQLLEGLGQSSVRGGADGEPLDEEECQLVCLKVGVLLIDLLSQLSIPPEYQNRARALMKRIEEGVQLQGLESVIEAVIELTLKAAVTGQEEFESYLGGLNAQLLDIQEFLTESRSHQQDARSSSQQLDSAVRSDVAQVEQSLASADSLEQLKLSVRAQLADIVLVMDRYRRDEAEREQQMEGRLAELQTKLESMESQAARVQAHLEEQRLRAMSDPLTALPNRAAYDERMKMEHARWARYAGELSLVVCDLDHFKQVNDNYGHLAGDKVLRLIGKILPAGIRETDFVARYGGEEFVVILPETEAERALLVMEKIRDEVARAPFNFKGEPVNITMSFGIAEFGPSETPEAVFARADEALYRAKQQGRNRCELAALPA